jgi:spermidine synthase
MGAILLATGKADEAIPHLNEALRTSTDQAQVYAELGAAYNQLGKYKEAIQSWTKTVELEPNSADVLNNLAWLLATAGDVSTQNADRAIKFAQRACEINGYEKSEFLDTLAAAYAAGGRFDEAMTIAGQAVKAAKAHGREDLAGEIQNRIKLYQAGQPYRQK